MLGDNDLASRTFSPQSEDITLGKSVGAGYEQVKLPTKIKSVVNKLAVGGCMYAPFSCS